MGVTTLTPTPITSAGIDQASTMTQCNSCGSRYKPHMARDFIRATNTTAATFTVTIKNQVGGSDIGPVTIPITTGDKTLGFYATPTSVSISDFIDADGYIQLEFGGTLAANTKIGVFRLP